MVKLGKPSSIFFTARYVSSCRSSMGSMLGMTHTGLRDSIVGNGMRYWFISSSLN